MIMTLIMALPQDMQGFAVAFYEKNKKIVWVTAFRVLHDKGWAEDVTQEVFVKLLKRLDYISGLNEEEQKAYVIISAKYAAYTFYRKEQKHEHADFASVDWQLASDGEGPEEAASHQEAVGYLMEKAEGLKPCYRDVLLLRVHYGLPFQEIGKILGITEGNARTRYSRGLAFMKKQVSREWRELH